METHAPSLGDRIAHLRQAAQAEETRAWIPAAIHALIIAALVRIFTRLEQVLALWQAGQLSPSAIRRPTSSVRVAGSRRDSAPRATRPHRATRTQAVPPHARRPRNTPQATTPTATAPAGTRPAVPPGQRPRQGRSQPAKKPFSGEHPTAPY